MYPSMLILAWALLIIIDDGFQLLFFFQPNI